MQKIVGLVGSPRKVGNSEIMVKEISRHIPADHELVLINLCGIKLEFCSGCYQCLYKKGECHLKDDMSLVIKELSEASGVILSAPTYFLGPHASVKVFIDRGLMFLARLEEFYGKPAVIVTVAGKEGKEGYTELALWAAVSFMGCQVKEKAIVYAAMPGEVFLDDKNKEIARHLGNVLLDPNYAGKHGPNECPLCSGSSFKFLDEGRVECLTCHACGKVTWQKGMAIMEIAPDPKNLLGDLHARLAHRAWLLSMKENFLEKKMVLKSVCNEYARGGRWIGREG